MAIEVVVFLSVMCAWCFLSGFTVMAVSAQPTVTAWIVTPERNQKIGGSVHMRCVANNLEADHIVEWRTENPINTLRWGNVTNAGGHDPRLLFETKQTGLREITQEFNITNLQPSDTDEYVCNVNGLISSGGHRTLATARITLRVYPSSESFPICSPDGPITADTGSELNMRCSSDTGNSPITVSQLTSLPNMYLSEWRVLKLFNGTLFRSLDLTLDITDDNLTFECIIFSMAYASLSHSCFVGPIHVRVGTLSPTGLTTEILASETQTATIQTTITGEETGQSEFNIALVAGASAGGFAALVLILILILFCGKKGLCATKTKPPRHNSDLMTALTNADLRTDELNAYDDHGIVSLGNHGADDVNIRQDTSDVPMYANPREPPNTSHSTNTPKPATVQDENTATPVYAKPHQTQPPGLVGPRNHGVDDLNIREDANDVPMFTNPRADPNVFQPVRTPASATGQADSTIALYAKPHKTQTPKQGDDGVHIPAPTQSEQRYSTPTFDSTYPESTTDSMPRKPTAKVPPMMKVPKKPPAYKPKPQRTSNPHDSSSHQPPVTLGATVESGQVGGSDKAQPPPSDVVSYAQISTPGNQCAAKPSQDLLPGQSGKDHIVYADLVCSAC
ncbi:uncharacterized protein LOC119744417 [Patiria miniata]|uniref:Ig-like domain-containing protein n=1 Tax=Patiria miniata TaxID=46514 RepID=A0A914BK25_PATMI|nr:uncharacterized protein LOC119744417 [Patiria miniata]